MNSGCSRRRDADHDATGVLPSVGDDQLHSRLLPAAAEDSKRFTGYSGCSQHVVTKQPPSVLDDHEESAVIASTLLQPVEEICRSGESGFGETSSVHLGQSVDSTMVGAQICNKTCGDSGVENGQSNLVSSVALSKDSLIVSSGMSSFLDEQKESGDESHSDNEETSEVSPEVKYVADIIQFQSNTFPENGCFYLDRKCTENSKSFTDGAGLCDKVTNYKAGETTNVSSRPEAVSSFGFEVRANSDLPDHSPAILHFTACEAVPICPVHCSEQHFSKPDIFNYILSSSARRRTGDWEEHQQTDQVEESLESNAQARVQPAVDDSDNEDITDADTQSTSDDSNVHFVYSFTDGLPVKRTNMCKHLNTSPVTPTEQLVNASRPVCNEMTYDVYTLESNVGDVQDELPSNDDENGNRKTEEENTSLSLNNTSADTVVITDDTTQTSARAEIINNVLSKNDTDGEVKSPTDVLDGDGNYECSLCVQFCPCEHDDSVVVSSYNVLDFVSSGETETSDVSQLTSVDLPISQDNASRDVADQNTDAIRVVGAEVLPDGATITNEYAGELIDTDVYNARSNDQAESCESVEDNVLSDVAVYVANVISHAASAVAEQQNSLEADLTGNCEFYAELEENNGVAASQSTVLVESSSSLNQTDIVYCQKAEDDTRSSDVLDLEKSNPAADISKLPTTEYAHDLLVETPGEYECFFTQEPASSMCMETGYQSFGHSLPEPSQVETSVGSLLAKNQSGSHIEHADGPLEETSATVVENESVCPVDDLHEDRYDSSSYHYRPCAQTFELTGELLEKCDVSNRSNFLQDSFSVNDNDYAKPDCTGDVFESVNFLSSTAAEKLIQNVCENKRSTDIFMNALSREYCQPPDVFSDRLSTLEDLRAPDYGADDTSNNISEMFENIELGQDEISDDFAKRTSSSQESVVLTECVETQKSCYPPAEPSDVLHLTCTATCSFADETSSVQIPDVTLNCLSAGDNESFERSEKSNATNTDSIESKRDGFGSSADVLLSSDATSSVATATAGSCFMAYASRTRPSRLSHKEFSFPPLGSSPSRKYSPTSELVNMFFEQYVVPVTDAVRECSASDRRSTSIDVVCDIKNTTDILTHDNRTSASDISVALDELEIKLSSANDDDNESINSVEEPSHVVEVITGDSEPVVNAERRVSDSSPRRKKSVRFADSIGCDLETVRHIESIPPEVPSIDNVSEYLQGLLAATDRRARWAERHPRQGIVATAWRNETPVYLRAMFDQPGTQSDFLDRVRRSRVVLENCTFDDSVFAMSGIVRVANIAYCKAVFIRYTLDSWTTQADVDAEYLPRSNDGTTDRFVFTIILPPRRVFGIGSQMEFAICYCAGDGDNVEAHWDNNSGLNYIIQCCVNSDIVTTQDED
jgi:hypothetical protein